MRRVIFILGSIFFLWSAVQVTGGDGQQIQPKGQLTTQERIKLHTDLDRVYYKHLLWPEENPSPKPPYDEQKTRTKIEREVFNTLKKSYLLEKQWGKRISGEDLQAEIDRMLKKTKSPSVLMELFSALNNDPHLIAECLARPVLVDRLIRNWYSNDAVIHGELRERVKDIQRTESPERLILLEEGTYSETSYGLKAEGTISNEAQQRTSHDAGSQLLVFDEFVDMSDHYPADRDMINFQETEEYFILRTTLERTDETLKGACRSYSKKSFEDWFSDQDFSLAQWRVVERNSYPYSIDNKNKLQGSFAPDQWILEDYVPSTREGHTAVWTGSEMIVWGGICGKTHWTGGKYNPTTDTWTPISTVTAPLARYGHTAVWTGKYMIVWGGQGEYGSRNNTGGFYHPSTDTWMWTNIDDAPDPRSDHTAVWTGTEMIIWGGTDMDGTKFCIGGRFNPVSNTWLNTPLPYKTSTFGVNPGTAIPNYGTIESIMSFDEDLGTIIDVKVQINITHTVDEDLDIFLEHPDGTTVTLSTDNGGTGDNYTNTTFSDGAVISIILGSPPFTGTYMPESSLSVLDGKTVTGTWILRVTDDYGRLGFPSQGNLLSWNLQIRSTGNCRSNHSAVWNGERMIVWGGYENTESSIKILNTGWRYRPVTGSMISTSTTNAPNPNTTVGHVAFWSGTEMLVYLGDTGTGGMYNSESDSWNTMSTNGDPLISHPRGVWTGQEMIVWGAMDGGRYSPSNNSWSSMTTVGAPPSYNTTVVWTGEEMIVWGGKTSGESTATSIYTLEGGRYNPVLDSWTPTAVSNGPGPRRYHTALWTGNEMIIWGGEYVGDEWTTRTGKSYNPALDTWNLVALPDGSCYRSRRNHSAVWTGTEMIIWGGERRDFGVQAELSCGMRYNVSSGTWTDLSFTNLPSPREKHTAVWTGTDMIVWGGSCEIAGLCYITPEAYNDGKRYNLSADTWYDIPAAPLSGRTDHTANWTGSEMIVWGGYNFTSHTFFNDGSIFDPQSGGSWSPMADTSAHTRSHHIASWTGTDLIIYGGNYAAILGQPYAYNPVDDEWIDQKNALWTSSDDVPKVFTDGSIEQSNITITAKYCQIVDVNVVVALNHEELSDVDLFLVHPDNTSVELSTDNGSGPGEFIDMAFDDEAGTPITTGSPPFNQDYQPEGSLADFDGKEVTGEWVLEIIDDTVNGGIGEVTFWALEFTFQSIEPDSRTNHTAVWTGKEVITWGGEKSYKFDTGWRLDPDTCNAWYDTPTENAPLGRTNHTAVWTGQEMIVWGGEPNSSLGMFIPNTPPIANPEILNPNDTITVGGSEDYLRLSMSHPLGWWDDVEGDDQWTPSGLWHTVDSANCTPVGDYTSESHAWYFGNDLSCDYVGAGGTYELILSTAYTRLRDDFDRDLLLSFQYFLDTDAAKNDSLVVSTSIDGGVVWNVVATDTSHWLTPADGFPLLDTCSEWQLCSVALPYANPDVSQSVLVKFEMIMDGTDNDHIGVLIDDVGMGYPPCDGSNAETTVPFHDKYDYATFLWDLNKDGIPDNEDQLSPILTLAETDLEIYGLDVPGDHQLTLKVIDSLDLEYSQPVMLHVLDGVAPSINIVSPNGGESWTYSASPADRKEHLIVWNSSDNYSITRTKISCQTAPGWPLADVTGPYGSAPWGMSVSGMPPDTPAQWIWTDDKFSDDTAYFRYSFVEAGGTMDIIITADESYELYLNGSLVGAGSGWSTSETYSSLPLAAGKNVVAVKGEDSSGIASILAELVINGSRVGTGLDWRVSTLAVRNWTAIDYDDEGSGWFVIADTAAQSEYLSDDIDVPIPDFSQLLSPISVPYDAPVLDVNVSVDINHPRVGDLIVSLYHDGQTVILSNQNGGTGADYDMTIFDDIATQPISTGSAPFSGSFNPDQPLSAFSSLSTSGEWVLQVEDVVSGETGGLNSWKISFGIQTLPVESQNFMWSMPTALEAAEIGQTFPSAEAKISIEVFDESGNMSSDVSDNNFYLVQPTTTGIKTLIFWNSDRMGEQYSGEEETLRSKLIELADHPKVSGLVLDLSTVTGMAAVYTAWSGPPYDQTQANDVAEAIRDYIMSQINSTYQNVQYLILVGDDYQIPFYRMPDGTGVYSEDTYPGEVSLNETTTIGSAVKDDYLLTDNYYSELTPEPSNLTGGDGSIYQNDFAIGRLVETPSQIIGVINAFLANNGTVDVSGSEDEVLVTGFDFMYDSTVKVRDLFTMRGFSQGGTLDCLMDDPDRSESIPCDDDDYTGSELGNQVFSNPIHKVMNINTHANHFTWAASTGSGLTTENMESTYAGKNLSGSIVYTSGCHSGLPVPSSDTNPIDLAEEMALKQTLAYIANTGYGWGIKSGIGLTERLIEKLTAQLIYNDSISIGKALAEAKRNYYLQEKRYDEFDEKVMHELTLFGIPNTLVVMESDKALYEKKLPPPEGPDHGCTNSVCLDKKLRRPGESKALPEDVTELELNFTFGSYGPVSTPDGDYYTLNGESSGEVGDSLQPHFVYESYLSGTIAHGVLFTGGEYNKNPGFDPVICAPKSTNYDGDEGSLPMSSTFTPRVRISYGTTGGSAQKAVGEVGYTNMVVHTGYFDQSDSTQYLFNDMQFVVYYHTSSGDTQPPSITPPVGDGFHSVLNGLTTTFTVQASDASGIYRVLVTYNDLSQSGWKSLDLTESGGTWTGSLNLKGGIIYFVQAVDNAGNVGMLTITDNDYASDLVTPYGTQWEGPEVWQIDVADGDSDGLPDVYENDHACLDVGVADADADPDYDYLTNIEELNMDIDPCAGDSDGGGDNDGSEFNNSRDAFDKADDKHITILPGSGTGPVTITWYDDSGDNADIDGYYFVYRSDTPFFDPTDRVNVTPIAHCSTRPGCTNDGDSDDHKYDDTCPFALCYYKVWNYDLDTEPPTVAYVDPVSGGASQSVSVYGNHFVPGATVEFCGVQATDVVVVNASLLTCTTPTGPSPGLCDVTVTNPNDQDGTLVGGYTY